MPSARPPRYPGISRDAVEVIEAPEDCVVLRGRPVDAGVVAGVDVGQRASAGEVVGLREVSAAVLEVGLWEERHQLGNTGVDVVGWNLVIGKVGAAAAGGSSRNDAGAGVDECRIRRNAGDGCGGRAEVADAFIIEGNGGDATNALLLARVFVVEKEEEAVGEHRAADAAAELVLVVLGLLGQRLLGEVVKGVEVLVAHVLICGAVEFVGAAAWCSRRRPHRERGRTQPSTDW